MIMMTLSKNDALNDNFTQKVVAQLFITLKHLSARLSLRQSHSSKDPFNLPSDTL